MNGTIARPGKIAIKAAVTLTAVFCAMPAAAFAEIVGQPTDGALGFQKSQSPIMDSTSTFHDALLLPIIIAIVIFVTALLIWVMVRYNQKANPEPSRTTHNAVIEVVWTLLPTAILIVIAVPSFGLLADQMMVPDGERRYLGSSIFSRADGEQIPAPEVTITARGYQWYWGYEYNDLDGASFDSILLSDEEIAAHKPGQPRLLAVDNEMVVPVGTTIRMLVTGEDVLHSFALPSLGIKTDAVPGRLNETWFNARKEGIYYGQCSELCGKDHAFMPIAVRVVSKQDYAIWAATLQAEDDVETANLTLASLN